MERFILIMQKWGILIFGVIGFLFVGNLYENSLIDYKQFYFLLGHFYTFAALGIMRLTRSYFIK